MTFNNHKQQDLQDYNTDSPCPEKQALKAEEDKEGDLEQKDPASIVLSSPDIDSAQAWFVVGVVFVTGFFFTIIIFGFNILYVEFSMVFQKPKAELGWVGSMEGFTESITGMFAGVASDRFGARPVFLFGALLMSGGTFLSAFATNVPTLYITYGVLVGSGYGCIQIARSVIVAEYFDKYRALAIGLSQSGICIGSVATPMMIRKLIDYFGWRGALIMLSGILLQSIPLLGLLRPPRVPKHMKSLANTAKRKTTLNGMWENFTDFSLLKRLDFTMYCISAMVFCAAFYVYVHHLPSRVVAKGLGLEMASILPTYLAMAVVVSKLVTSFLANCSWCDVVVLHMLIILIGGLDMVGISISTSVGYMIFNAAVFGAVIGWFYTTNLITLVEFVGPEAFARAQGISMLLLAPLALIATPLAGFMYDVSGDYDIPYYVAGSLMLIGGGLLIPVCISRYRQKHKHSVPTIVIEVTVDRDEKHEV